MSDSYHIYRSIFKVNKTPYCVWGYDLKERNLAYLKGYNHQYFKYVAELQIDQLDGDNRQLAAMTLRKEYHHAQETLFSLLCAAVQAPTCVYGWVLKCTSGQLKELVQAISVGRSGIFNHYGWDCVTWDKLSQHIHVYSNPEPARAYETGEQFAKLWRSFADDFLSQDNLDEYNSIKHGFRVRSGGFTLMAGLEEEPGIPAPPENMQLVGHTEFGSSFPRAEPLGNLPGKQRNPNFHTRWLSLSWNPLAIVSGLSLISMSIENTLSFLRIVNGEPPQTVRFSRPQESEDFSLPWKNSPDLSKFSIDYEIDEADIQTFTVRELEEIIGRAFENQDEQSSE
jgi:hypothetical protein